MRPLLPALALGALAALVACGAVDSAPSTAPAPPSTVAALQPVAAVPDAPSDRALDVLGTLPVKGRAPKTGYSREQFGPAWTDVDHSGCDQRNDVLRRDLTGETFKPGTHDCVVLTGHLDDPYTGKSIDFVRGTKTSTAVQIDHVVALSNAWQTGAQALDEPGRAAIAGDPLNLVAVDGPTNEAKGDGDFATWKPPVRTYWCRYAARIVAVKAKHHLWTTDGEHRALAETLSSCPDEPVPSG